MSKKNKNVGKVVVITGASAGIGFSVANIFCDNGWTVYALARREKVHEKIKFISCDVTDYEAVKASIDKIYDAEKRIDILINNAGMGISGSIENTELDEAKYIFDVNFFGMFHCIKATLPYLRQQRFGSIINLSSVAAAMAIPFQSFYTASKAAVSGFSEALQNEVKPYKIKVLTLLPGDVKTDFTAARRKNKDDGDYSKRVEKSVAVMEKDEQNGMSTRYVAKVIYKVSTKKRPPMIRTIGGKYRLIMGLSKILPKRFINFIIGKIYGGY